uniref:Thiolase 2 n=2 Tax=Heliothis virescens TaxID=7102 RepID=M4M7W4_HELVI|nr:thiolase 2 [Heliothis virescens]
MAVAVKKGVYIVAAKRTPFGKFGGLLRDVLAEDLFAIAATAALRAGNVAAELVDTVNIGQASPVSQSGLSPRHAALKAGIPSDRPVLGMNRLSGSGFHAIICGAQEILIGSAQISLAGGMENVSSIPFLRDVRFGIPLGKYFKVDDLLHMGFFDSYCNLFLVQTADIVAAKYGVTREETDEFALRSQQRWKLADAAGIFNEEQVPVPVTLKNREILMTKDEYPQPDSTLENLSKLQPIFQGGVTTPGNSSGVNDGAGAVILAHDEALKTHNLKPLARLVGWSCSAVDPTMMGIAAVPAVQNLLNCTGLTIDDMDLVEIHETYAATTVVCARQLAVDVDRINVNGGAIAIGHAFGASGARIMTHLTHELRRRRLKRALATTSIAGGQSVAVMIETV